MSTTGRRQRLVFRTIMLPATGAGIHLDRGLPWTKTACASYSSVSMSVLLGRANACPRRRGSYHLTQQGDHHYDKRAVPSTD